MPYESYTGEDSAPQRVLEELARTNRFSMADLEANRRGIIAQAQHGRLTMRALRPVRFAGATLFGWLLFCLVINTFVPNFVLWLLAMFSGGRLLYVAVTAMTAACVFAFLVALYKSLKSLALLTADLRGGKALCVEGRVSPSHEVHSGLGLARLHGEKHTSYWYVIQDQYFDVEQEAHAALPPGRFKLYYTPQSKMLLSIEPR